MFVALHLPYLPASLEDVDSINFALGMRRFDVAQHQPHPPGYPVYIAVARGVHAFVPSEARALGVVSTVSGALGVLALVALFRRIGGSDDSIWPQIAALVAMTAPLYWFTAARPLSDTLGLAAAVAVQALILSAESSRALIVAASLAGFAIGIRSQVLWLTLPLLVLSGFTGRALAAFAAGIAAWFVPLVVLSGGPAAYWHALFDQGAEDLSGIRMLWTTPTPRAFVDALYYAFVAPWAAPVLAAGALALAAVGAAILWRRNRRALTALAVAFGPYLVFDMLFQETFTSRYALPIVVPVAFLAMAAARAAPVPLALVAMAPVVMYGAHIGGRSIAAYSREAAPAFRLLADMRSMGEGMSTFPILAPDRRLSFDLRRPMAWAGDSAPRFARQLPSPPQHEWLEAVKYWNAGGRAPLWFVVDPMRAAIDFVQHDDALEYRRELPYPVLASGTRPNEADWYRVGLPDWYVEEGWALTPELAGVAQVDGRGLSQGPIRGHVRTASLSAGTLVVGGRNFESSAGPQLTVAIGDRWRTDMTLQPGAFLRIVRLPDFPSAADAEGFEPITITSNPPARAAVEQFDVAPPERATRGFGPGWHEAELNPATGARWRWLSDRSEIQYTAPPGGAFLRIAGESPSKYYSRPSRLVVRAGERVLREVTLSTDFEIEVKVPAANEPSTIVVETDQTHVPAERRGWRGVTDRRKLGLRIYSCEVRPLRPVSAPRRAASSQPAR